MIRQLTRDRAVRVACTLVVLAFGGEAGHVFFDQLNAAVAHHFFHIVFPLVAFAVFAGFVMHDVRRHGWPTFSWRLRATPVAQRANQSHTDPRGMSVRPR